MSLFVALFSAVLFFILTPSILLRIPKNGSKYTVAAVHALVFGIVFFLLHKFIWRLGNDLGNMMNPPVTVNKDNFSLQEGKKSGGKPNIPYTDTFIKKT
jgi:hypothetical protein